MQYFISRGDLYALQLTTLNSSLTRLTPINRDRDNTDDTDTNPFLIPDSGSGLNTADFLLPEPSGAQQYVYTIHHRHAFIAVGQYIIELLLNTDTPNYHRIRIGHTALKLEARTVADETYLFVLYETNNRGYVATYRKYSNRNWGKYGRYDVLVYSPEWFDITKMSNIIFFSADDWHYSYKVTYIAVAVGHTIYFKEILDSFEFSIAIPEPCNRILSINFNEVKQTLFVVCTNITFYFSYLDYQIYTSGLWNRTGLTDFSDDGRIAAIATNHSGGMTTVTIHGLNFEPISDHDETVYEFHHFHHVASRSLIIIGDFVTASKTLHYYCYIEQMQYGIVCISVERALQNVRNEGIINDATFILPNTHAVLCSSTKSCPVMYSHREILAVQVNVCEQDQECVNIAMFFNMSSLENFANVTDVSLDMLAFKADTHPILISPPRNKTLIKPHATKTVSAITSTTVESSTPQKTPSVLPPLNHWPTLNTPANNSTATNTELADLLETCQSDLVITSDAYSQLLSVTITLCVCFSVAMLITILILVGLICYNRKEKSHACKDCKN